MKREASAEWRGTLQEGSGTVSSASGALSKAPYGFRSRFADGPETNPEELIAAAHAACFSMALSVQLGNSGLTPESIRTRATANFEKLESGWTVTGMHLDVQARVPGADAAAFAAAAEAAKQGCPISRLLKALPITMSAALET
jgi:osmotically inducible protein OsmC